MQTAYESERLLYIKTEPHKIRFPMTPDMGRIVWCAILIVLLKNVYGIQYYANDTLDPASRQLLDFQIKHPEPIGVHTTQQGKPVEVRESTGFNREVFNNPLLYDNLFSGVKERIPERIVHAKGTGAFGYFEVTNDVSKYTEADVFNGIGKRTKTVVRFSVSNQGLGGLELVREAGAMVVKLYTNEGNLDFLGFNFPVFLYRDPAGFLTTAHTIKRNPKTNLFDRTSFFEFFSLVPDTIHMLLWLFSDFGIPNGYRKMDAFPIHTYELNNKHGDIYYVRFNFRTEQGVELLTTEAATALRSLDQDYSTRDLYNAIARGDFPAWKLEMDVIPKDDIKKLNYNPFDVTRYWENGTYITVPIGRLVLNRNPDNAFKDIEQAAFNPGNLVPGIPGPRDTMFRARRMAYRITQTYRLGVNHNKIAVNSPKFCNLYSRDGVPPVRDNMKDAPNYYQNSYNGPVPYVDSARPKEFVLIYDRNAVDLQPPADFYNTFVRDEAHRDRLARNIAGILVGTVELTQRNVLRLLFLVDVDLGTRVTVALQVARVQQAALQPVLSVIQKSNGPRTLDIAPRTI